MSELRLEWLNPETLKPHPQNWRRHPQAQKDALEAVIGEVGWAGALLYNERSGHLIDGHLRQEISRDGPVPVLVGSWTEEQERLILATLDPIAALAEAESDALAVLLATVETESAAVKALLEGLAEQEGIDLGGEPVADPGAQVSRADELQEKWQVKTGDLWEIGAHRLICGDCTDRAVVGRVMGGEKAQLFATDPPYGCHAGNIGFTAQRDDIEAITKDDLEGHEMQAFLESAFRAWIPHLEKNCAWYLWHPMLTQGYFAAAAAAAAADLIIHRQIIWRKEQFIFGRGDYHWRHELCFYGWRQGHRPPFYGERNQDTVWDIAWGMKRSKTGHPTTKPVELFAIPVRNHTKRGEICAEPFLGSGSQMIACEQLHRRCFGIEIEPKYCAVTLERLAGMGLESERIK